MTDLIEQLISEREAQITTKNLKTPVEKRILYKEDQRWNELRKLSSGIAELMLDLISSADKDRRIKEYMDICEKLSTQLNEGKKLLAESKELLKLASYGPHNSNLGAKIKHFLENHE